MLRISPRSCPACGGPLEDEATGHQSGVTLRRCSSCGSAVASGGVEEPAAAYAWPRKRRFHAAISACLAVGVHEQVRALGPLAPHSRVLDVGAGEGRLAAVLARRGHEVDAVEPFRDVAAARGLPGVTVLRSSLDELVLPEGAYDVAVLWHALEHLSDPLAALQRVHTWLKEGGRLVVAVPNFASLQALIGGPRWFQLDLPRHLVHFTPSGLGTLLTRAGFVDSRLYRTFFDQALPGMWMTLLDRVAPRPGALRSFVRREPVRRRDVAAAAAAAAPALVAAVPLELGATALRRGGAIVAVARRA